MNALICRNRFSVVVGAACLLASILILASQLSARTEQQARAATAGERATIDSSLFAGIVQRGAVLGSARAPLTLVEYADLQCPYCGEWARMSLPVLIERYVRSGKLRIVFNGLAFVGPDSERALRTVIAAGQQDHLWDLVHGLYERQGPENSGWFGDELVAGLAAAVPGLDGAKLLAVRSQGSVAAEIERSATAAQAAGVNSTPSFELGSTGGQLKLVRVSSLGPEGIVPAIEAALHR